jgi:hypothetical protein
MKKVMLTLAVVLLVCAPALADVIISHETVDGKCAVKYQVTAGEKVRAFALDITVDGGQTIDAISGFLTGESTAEAKGYGIFPANFARYITVTGAGEVEDWDADPNYTPVADVNDPGALGGLGTDGITVELGSLYYPAGDDSDAAPGDEGILFMLDIEEACNVTYELNAMRGGIVLTDPEAAVTVDLQSGPFDPAGGEKFDKSHPDYPEWEAMGKPECWTYTRQCYGDADGLKEGSAKTGYAYVATADLNTLISAWLVKEPPNGPGIATITNGICADFARDQEGSSKTGYARVSTSDLNILIGNFLVKEPPNGAGIPSDGCGGSEEP